MRTSTLNMLLVGSVMLSAPSFAESASTETDAAPFSRYVYSYSADSYKTSVYGQVDAFKHELLAVIAQERNQVTQQDVNASQRLLQSQYGLAMTAMTTEFSAR